MAVMVAEESPKLVDFVMDGLYFEPTCQSWDAENSSAEPVDLEGLYIVARSIANAAGGPEIVRQAAEAECQ